MEWHIKCDADEISRYVFCPGDHLRAKRIADQFDSSHLVTESRGYTVYSGEYRGIFMTVCGTGMGGPAVAIGLEELAHMGADTFIRVGSCGVFQENQKPGDVIAASGTVRAGGTANSYLPTIFPAVPTFSVLRSLVETAEELKIPMTVGVGLAGDAFYGVRDAEQWNLMKEAGLVFVEMESDTLFIVGAARGWRTAALFTSDGAAGVVKPDWGWDDFRRGEMEAIRIALDAMWKIAQADQATA
ncbi:MAG TPA: nucleoside phosphorylase [Anaerolineales bacterium]|nr:nucleoside phosphorylase [Anaerolineales bacterium]